MIAPRLVAAVCFSLSIGASIALSQVTEGQLADVESRLVAASGGAAQASSQSESLRRRIDAIRARRGAQGGAPSTYAPGGANYDAGSDPGESSAQGAEPIPPRGIIHPGRLRVGVLPFEIQVPQLPGNFVANLEAMVISEGLKRTDWSMLDRVITADVLREQKFARSGLVRPGTGPQTGLNLGAQVLIKGAITELTAGSSGGGFGFGFRGVSVGRGGSKSTLGMDIRIVDAATGEVLAADHASAKIKSSDLSVGVNVGRGPALRFDDFKNSPAGEAARSLVGRILQLLDEGVKKVRIETPTRARWSGLVAKVESGQVYVNGGENVGLRPGQALRVFAAADAVIDPRTGENLGTSRNVRATVRVVDVQQKFAVCQVMDGQLPRTGDVVEE